jgi:hypothetical protein
MTKDEALDLALEALEESLYATTAKSQLLAFEALTAIKQARSASVQEPVAYRSRMRNRDGQVITGWVVHTDTSENPDPRIEIEPLYTTPPAAVVNQQLTTEPAAPLQEPPPECQTEAEKRAYAFGWWKALEANRGTPVQKPVAWTVSGKITDWSKDFSAYQTKHYTRPVYTQSAAQRQWVSLTDEELKAVTRLEGANSRAQLDLGKAFWAGARWAEAQLKEKNT